MIFGVQPLCCLERVLYITYTWIFNLKSKLEVTSIFKFFYKTVKRQLGVLLKSIQIDWGGEYKTLLFYLQEQGLEYRVSCPYTHQQHSKAKRKHRHIVELRLVLLSQANMLLTFWWEAFQTSVFLVKEMPFVVLLNDNPFHLLFLKQLDNMFLKSFGCACYPFLKPYNHHKFDFHTKK